MPPPGKSQYDQQVLQWQQQRHKRLAQASARWSQLLAAKQGAGHIREKLHQAETESTQQALSEPAVRSYQSCTFRSLIRPSCPSAYTGRYSLLCCACGIALGLRNNDPAALRCHYCSYAAHRSCITSQSMQHSESDAGWMCPECVHDRQVDAAYFISQKNRTMIALRQHDAACLVTRFIAKAAKRLAALKEQDRSVRIKRLLQLNLSNLQANTKKASRKMPCAIGVRTATGLLTASEIASPSAQSQTHSTGPVTAQYCAVITVLEPIPGAPGQYLQSYRCATAGVSCAGPRMVIWNEGGAC